MTEAKKAEFIVVQRCATYGFWPEAPVESGPFAIDNPGEQTQTSVSICAEHFGNVEDHSQPPTPMNYLRRFAFGFSIPTGFRSGAEYYVHDEGLRIQLRKRFPFAGEVDIFCRLTSASADLPPTEICNRFVQLMPALLLLIRITTQDIIVPTWQLVTVSDVGGKLQQHTIGDIIRIAKRERQRVTPEQISSAFKVFGSLLHPGSNKESLLRLAIAARRIMNAYNETDLIDRFSDLWEACEMLCPPKRGKIDYRIAKRASDFTEFDQHLIKTHVVSKLYDIRKDIVHSFVEDFVSLNATLPLLFDLASILYASYLPVSYGHKGPVADTMQAAP